MLSPALVSPPAGPFGYGFREAAARGLVAYLAASGVVRWFISRLSQIGKSFAQMLLELQPTRGIMKLGVELQHWD
jgi:glycine cleavage system regulatory protein